MRPEHTEDMNDRVGQGLILVMAIGVSALIAHYGVQVMVLMLGGHPDFADRGSIGINVGVASFFLLLGWLTRRVWLVTLCFLVLGLAFLTPYLFVLKGTISTVAMQLSTYIGLPLISGGMFLALSRALNIPMRGQSGRRR